MIIAWRKKFLFGAVACWNQELDVHIILHLTTLPNFILPGDTAGSSRYWEEDVISPEVIVEHGYITVPTAYGIGYEPIVKPWIHTLWNVHNFMLIN